RKEAGVAEGARPEFGRALKPADHPLVGEQFCGVPANIVATPGVDLDADKKLLQRTANLLIAVWLADIGVVHHEAAASFEDFEPTIKGATDRDAVVTGRRLDPDIAETAFAGDPAVRHAIQGNAAG